MAAIALIKFSQADGTDSPAGESHPAVFYFAPDTAKNGITITNGDNTDVASWKIELLYNPPGSALGAVPGTPVVLAQATSNTPTANFSMDVPGGCYRVRMTVWDGGGVANIDVRNVGALTGRGFVTPPYQKLPDPLPLPATGLTGNKPDELNFGGQEYGWLGDAGSGLHSARFEQYDDLPFQEVTTTPFTAPNNGKPLIIVDLTTIGADAELTLPDDARVGERVRVAVPDISAHTLTILPAAGGSIDGGASKVASGPFVYTFVHTGASAWLLGAGTAKSTDLEVVQVATTPYTATTAQGANGEELFYVVNLTTIGVAAVFNLPTTDLREGQRVTVTAFGNTSHRLTVNPPGGHTIDGASVLYLRAPNAITFVYLGSSSWGRSLNKYDDYYVTTVTTTPYTTSSYDTLDEELLYVVDLTAIGGAATFNLSATGMRVGQRIAVIAFGSTAYTLTLNPPGGHSIDGVSTPLYLRAPNLVTFVYLGGTSWSRSSSRYIDYNVTPVTTTPYTAYRYATLEDDPLYAVNMTTTGPASFILSSGFRLGQRITIRAYGSEAYPLTITNAFGTIDGRASVVIRAPNTITLVSLGGNTWLMLGVHRMRNDHTLFAGVASTDTTGFTRIGSAVLINPTDFPNCDSTATWKAVIETTDGADAAEVRLYNLSLGAVVADSVLSTTSLTPEQVSATVTLAAGLNLYEAQLRLQTTGAPNKATAMQANLSVKWLG